MPSAFDTPNSTVTIGLATHDVRAEAWLVLPEKYITHVVDEEKSSSVGVVWKPANLELHAEHVHIKAKEPLVVKLLEKRETDWGGFMYRVDLGGGKERWFAEHLVNCNMSLTSVPNMWKGTEHDEVR